MHIFKWGQLRKRFGTPEQKRPVDCPKNGERLRRLSDSRLFDVTDVTDTGTTLKVTLQAVEDISNVANDICDPQGFWSRWSRLNYARPGTTKGP